MNDLPVADFPAPVQSQLLRALGIVREQHAVGLSAEDLAGFLYANWYAATFESILPPVDLPRDIPAMLRAAVMPRSPWESGWTAEEIGRGGYVAAVRGDERRYLDRCEYVVPASPGLMASPGAELLVKSWNDALDPEHGWWFAHSPGWHLDAPEGPLVRLYWHVLVGDVATFVGVATDHLADWDRGWLLKCAVAPEIYRRADAIVLYVQCDAVDAAVQIVNEVRSSVDRILQRGVPPLTLQIGRGLAAADDPGQEESFGQHRCRLVAEAITSSGLENDDEAIVGAIAQRFVEAGVPPARPYLSCESRSLPWE